MENKILLSTIEAAQLLCCSKRKLETDRIQGGGIPYIKIGRCVRYHKHDLEQYIGNRRFTQTNAY